MAVPDPRLLAPDRAAMGFSTQATLSAGDLDASTRLAPGLADNTLALSALFDDAARTGKRVVLPAGRDIVSGPIVKTGWSPQIAANGARIISRAGTTAVQALWRFEGTTDPIVTTTGQLFEGDTVIPVPTAGIGAGDTIIIGENTIYDVNSGVESLRFVGQQARVKSIDSAAQLTLLEPLYRGFSTGAKIRRVNPLIRPKITDLRMLNQDRDVASNYCGGLWIKYGVGVDVEVETEGMTAGGLRIYSCYDFRTRSRHLHHLWNVAAGQFGYGMDVIAASTHGRCEVHAQESAEAWTTNGWDNDYGEPQNITVTGEHFGSPQGGFSTHAAGRWITFLGVRTYGCANGLAIRCRDVKAIDCRFERCPGTPGAGTVGHGIWLFDQADDAHIENCDIAYTSRLGLTANRGLQRVKIVNNRFLELQESAIASNDAGVANWTIQGNEFTNVGRAQLSGQNRCIRFVNAVTDMTVAYNHSHDTTADGNKGTKHLCESNNAGSARIKAYGNVAHDGLPLGTAQGTNGMSARFDERKIDAAGAANLTPAYP